MLQNSNAICHHVAGWTIPLRDGSMKYPVDLQKKKLLIKTSLFTSINLQENYCKMLLSFYEDTDNFNFEVNICAGTYALEHCSEDAKPFAESCYGTTREWQIIRTEEHFQLICNEVIVADIEFKNVDEDKKKNCYTNVANNYVKSVVFDADDRASYAFKTVDLGVDTGD